MQFLKKSVDALHNKLTREQAEHNKNRILVMETNQLLIEEIGEQSTGLRGSIENLKIEFNKLGGSKELNKILKKNAEREKMLEYIE